MTCKHRSCVCPVPATPVSSSVPFVPAALHHTGCHLIPGRPRLQCHALPSGFLPLAWGEGGLGGGLPVGERQGGAIPGGVLTLHSNPGVAALMSPATPVHSHHRRQKDACWWVTAQWLGVKSQLRDTPSPRMKGPRFEDSRPPPSAPHISREGSGQSTGQQEGPGRSGSQGESQGLGSLLTVLLLTSAAWGTRLQLIPALLGWGWGGGGLLSVACHRGRQLCPLLGSSGPAQPSGWHLRET